MAFCNLTDLFLARILGKLALKRSRLYSKLLTMLHGSGAALSASVGA